MSDKEKIYAPVDSQTGDMTHGLRISPTDDALTTTNDENPNNDDQYKNLPIVKYIKQTFTKRKCKRYLSKNDSVCCCGYPTNEHSESTKKNGRDVSRPWDAKTDTEELPTDAFGEVEFVISGQKICKYVRVNHTTRVDDLMTLMLDHWQMERPNLLISVTGGAQNFTMKPRLKEVFRQGLVKAAESTRAWIITGGTNAGVMKQVGEALRDYTIKHGSKKQLVALGIATWGCIENKEGLAADPNSDQTFSGFWPASYKSNESLQKRKETPLDPNHTHFILVDNGTHQQFGVEIELRAKLERKISKMKTDEESVSIPVVCVVLEGGPNTLETVKKAIEAGTPAIIVAGSGRAADILAYAYSKCKEEEVDIEDNLRQKATIALYDDSLWDEVALLVEKEFNKKNRDDILKTVDVVRACIEKIDHLTVFRLDGGSSAKDIDITILRALLKVNRGKRINQLRLALAWDRVDVAKEEIYTDGVRFEESELQDLMFSAIVNNRVEFVKLFLEKGLSLKDFLTIRRIQDLYNHPVTSDRCRLLRKMAKKKEPISLKKVAALMKELNGELFEPEYCDKKYIYHPEAPAQPKKPQSERHSVTIALGQMNPITTELLNLFDEPARDIFLWCVLTQRKEMAMVFWYEAKEDLSLAVIAHLLLRNIMMKEQDSELNQELMDQVTHYEDLGIGLLSECHSSDPRKTIQLLVRELSAFGRTTTLKVAVEADNKNFVAHPACQSLLTEIWTGKLSDDNNHVMMLLSFFCPPLAPLLLKFREKELHQATGQSATQPRYTAALQTQSSGGASPLKKNESQADLLNGATSTRLAKEWSTSQPPVLSYFQKMGFFFQAPVVKFAYNCMSYFAFLLLFGVILLTDFYPTIGIKEQILIAWVFTLIFEEIRQVAMDDATEPGRKMYNYITDIWNNLDVLTIVTFLAGMILRFIPVSICGNCFYAARIILALNFMIFFFRILHMFSIHRELGPKLVMIGKMMIDLFYFMIILLVFIAAYGIASHVILYPNQPLNIALARDVLSRPWWNIFGELGLDEVSGDTCNDSDSELAEECASKDYYDYSASGCSSYKDNKCPAIDWLVPILLAIYTLVTNVLMLNLLIAMFSNTFSNIQGQTNVIWKMQRYHLVREYDSRPLLPPPLIFLAHIYIFIRYLVRHCCPSINYCAKDSSNFRLKFQHPADEKDLINWENVNAEEFLRKRESDEREKADSKARETSDRIDLILRKVEEIAEANFLVSSSSTDMEPLLPPALANRLNHIEKQMEWIMENMKSSGKHPNIDRKTSDARQMKQDEEIKIEKAKQLLRNRMTLHQKARDSVYPKDASGQSVSRSHVPDEFVSFEVDFPDYSPDEFTDSSWPVADVNFDRPSWTGLTYRPSADGYPLNPRGRTGLRGRGNLKHWGPNHVVNVVITRWKKNEEEQKLLEFISIRKQPENEQSIPEEEASDHDISSAVQACFEKVLQNSETVYPRLSGRKKEVYRGYLDDSRNTDNAWLETVTLCYHVKNDEPVEIKIGNGIRWLSIRSDLPLYGTHLLLLSYVAKSLGAAFF